MRGLEKSVAIFIGTGESALHVTEELGFQKRFRKSPAVNGDEGILGAGAVFVNGARDEFLTRAAFAGDENAAVLRSDIFNQIEYRAHLGAGADDVVESR